MKLPVFSRFRREEAALSGVRKITAMLVTLCLALALSGCATATFAPVRGEPMPGKMGGRASVNSCLALSIYSGPPDRPYVVIGIVHAASGSKIMQAARAAVREAAEHGADALVLLNEYEKWGEMTTTGTSFTLWDAYSRDAFSDWPCRELGVPPGWRAAIAAAPEIYKSELVFAAIRWL